MDADPDGVKRFLKRSMISRATASALEDDDESDYDGSSLPLVFSPEIYPAS